MATWPEGLGFGLSPVAVEEDDEAEESELYEKGSIPQSLIR